VNTTFFSEMLQSIAERSRALIKRERREPAHERSAGLIELCEDLLSGRGEASGVALAQEILARYAELTTGHCLLRIPCQDFWPRSPRHRSCHCRLAPITVGRNRGRPSYRQRAAATRIVSPA
jgi:hypothetical protein